MKKHHYRNLTILAFIISFGLLATAFYATYELKEKKAEASENVRLLEEGVPMGGRAGDMSEWDNLYNLGMFSIVGFAIISGLAFIFNVKYRSMRNK